MADGATVNGEGWVRLGYEANPIQVDLDGVEKMATDWREISEAIQLLRSEIASIEDGKLKSDAVDETKKKARDLSKKLEEYDARYTEAAYAAGVFNAGIEGKRNEAQEYARQAEALDKLGETKPVKGKAVATQAAADDQDRLDQLKAQLENAVSEAEGIAKTFENAINKAKKHGKDTCMDKFKAILKIILKVLMIIGMVLAAAGFIFGGWVIIALGVAVGVVNLVLTAINYAIGAGSLFDLITAIVFLGCDVLALGMAIKAGAAAFKMTKITKVIDSAKTSFTKSLKDFQKDLAKLQKNVWGAGSDVLDLQLSAIIRGTDGGVGALSEAEAALLKDLKSYLARSEITMKNLESKIKNLNNSLRYIDDLGDTAGLGKLKWSEIFEPFGAMNKLDLEKWGKFVDNFHVVTSFDKGWASTFAHGLIDRLGFKDLRTFIKGLDPAAPAATTFGISDNIWKGLGITGWRTFDTLRAQWWGPFNFGNQMWETHGDLFQNEHDRTSPFSQWKADHAVTP